MEGKHVSCHSNRVIDILRKGNCNLSYTLFCRKGLVEHLLFCPQEIAITVCKTCVYNVRLLIILGRLSTSMYRKKKRKMPNTSSYRTNDQWASVLSWFSPLFHLLKFQTDRPCNRRHLWSSHHHRLGYLVMSSSRFNQNSLSYFCDKSGV